MRVLLACVGAALACGIGPSAEAAYRIEPVVLDGDPAEGGGTLVIFNPGLTRDGELLVQADVNDPPFFGQKNFFYRGDGIEVLLVAGTPAPGGGVFTSFDMLTSPGDQLAFWAAVDGAVLGIYRLSGGVATELAKMGAPAPLPGSSYADIEVIADVSDTGRVLFYATLDTAGGPRDGWILDDGGVQQVVALEGDPTPAGGSFDQIPPFGARIFPDGSVVFGASVVGGSSPEGLFRFTGSGMVPELLAGDPVPTPGGGSFTGFWSAIDPNASGEYAFLADVDRNGRDNLNALYVRTAAGLREVAFPLEPVPGGAGSIWGSLADFALDDAGRVAFFGFTQSPGPPFSGSLGLFFWDGTDSVPVALEGVPTLGGITFGQLGFLTGLSNDGRIFLEAGASTPAAYGIFSATPEALAVPSLPAGSLPLLAVGLLAAYAATHGVFKQTP